MRMSSKFKAESIREKSNSSFKCLNKIKNIKTYRNQLLKRILKIQVIAKIRISAHLRGVQAIQLNNHLATRVHYYWQMVTNIRVLGKKVKLMAKEYTQKQMEINMLASGTKARNMEQARRYGLIARYTSAISFKTKKKAKANISLGMVQNTAVFGKRIK